MNVRALRKDEFQASFLCASKVTLGPSLSPVTSLSSSLLSLEGWEGRTLGTSGEVSREGAGAGAGAGAGVQGAVELNMTSEGAALSPARSQCFPSHLLIYIDFIWSSQQPLG